MNLPQSKVALVYDWLTAEFGGAEHVLIELHKLFPEAPLFTSVWNKEKTPWTKGWDVRTSFLQHSSWLRNNHTLAAPLLPLAFESFDFKEFDVVISVTSFAAKGVLTLPHQLHLSYVLTPPRFLYTHTNTYWQGYGYNGFMSWLTQPLLAYLRRWDKTAAFRPDATVAISQLVSDRITQTYAVKTETVVYPPIPRLQTAKNQPSKPITISPQWWRNSAASKESTIERPLITGGRLVAYKQFGSLIDIAQDFGQPLLIFGDGPERQKLQSQAEESTVPIVMTGLLSDIELENIVANATLAVYPAEEDFGITQVQIAQTGVPLILHQNSGAAEIIKNWPNVRTVPDSSLETLLGACKNIHPLVEQKVQPKSKIYDTTTFGESFLKTFNDVSKKHNAVHSSTNW